MLGEALAYISMSFILQVMQTAIVQVSCTTCDLDKSANFANSGANEMGLGLFDDGGDAEHIGVGLE